MSLSATGQSVVLAGLAALLFGRVAVGETNDRSPSRGYILISIDTLRADHLSSYGYKRKTSPFESWLA